MPGPKLEGGDSILKLSAREWNRHVDAAEAYHRAQAIGSSRSGALPSGRDTNIVKVKNSSGANRRKGDILEFTSFGLADSEVDNAFFFVGGSPVLQNNFVILLRAIPIDDYDDCLISGVGAAWVNVTDLDHRYARPIASTYVLQSAAIGPVKILFRPSTGEVACAVNYLGVSGEILVKNESGGDYAANGGPNEYHVYAGTPPADTGQLIEAYNIPEFKDTKMGAASLLEGIPYACPWQQ
jgi:hypothetical protein